MKTKPQIMIVNIKCAVPVTEGSKVVVEALRTAGVRAVQRGRVEVLSKTAEEWFTAETGEKPAAPPNGKPNVPARKAPAPARKAAPKGAAAATAG